MGSRSRRATEGCHDRAEMRRRAFVQQYNDTPSNFMPPVSLARKVAIAANWPNLQALCGKWIETENERRRSEGYSKDQLIPWPVMR